MDKIWTTAPIDLDKVCLELDGLITYSNGSLRERGKGHWQARFCRTDSNGSTVIAKTFDAPSHRAAQLRMAEIRQDLINQDAQNESSTNLIEYMIEYIEDRVATGLIEPSTATNYRSSVKHIKRYLNNYTLGEVTPESIMAMQAGLLEEGLVPDTVAKDYRLLKQVMAFAVELGHIRKSPFVKALKPPKRRKPKPNALDEKSRAALLSVLDMSPTTRQSIAARLGLLAGMRREEVAALRWNDIDFNAGTIKIENAIGVADGKPYEKGAKTDAGERYIVLAENLASVLKMYRKLLGSTVRGGEYVLGHRGRFYSPDRITKDFTSLAKTMNLTGVTGKRATFHDLRDTFATHLLVTKKVDVKTVSYLLGHQNPAFTIATYISNTPAGFESAAEALGSLSKH